MTTQDDEFKYMLVLDDRVFYKGLIGHKMKTRRLGALTLYLAPSGDCRIKEGDGAWNSYDLAVVSPYQSHQVETDSGSVIHVLIEPEKLDAEGLSELVRQARDPERRQGLIERFCVAAMRLPEAAPDGDMGSDVFDRIVLGRALPTRKMDLRIADAIGELQLESPEAPLLASDLAEGIGLSSSRFLHLFKEQTGISFRNYRMWRRARTFLVHANHDSSLTDVALSLGYPDSSHFSHSIRKVYGMKPRSIRVGSQNLQVASSPRMAAALYV